MIKRFLINEIREKKMLKPYLINIKTKERQQKINEMNNQL